MSVSCGSVKSALLLLLVAQAASFVAAASLTAQRANHSTEQKSSTLLPDFFAVSAEPRVKDGVDTTAETTGRPGSTTGSPTDATAAQALTVALSTHWLTGSTLHNDTGLDDASTAPPPSVNSTARVSRQTASSDNELPETQFQATEVSDLLSHGRDTTSKGSTAENTSLTNSEIPWPDSPTATTPLQNVLQTSIASENETNTAISEAAMDASAKASHPRLEQSLSNENRSGKTTYAKSTMYVPSDAFHIDKATSQDHATASSTISLDDSSIASSTDSVTTSPKTTTVKPLPPHRGELEDTENDANQAATAGMEEKREPEVPAGHSRELYDNGLSSTAKEEGRGASVEVKVNNRLSGQQATHQAQQKSADKDSLKVTHDHGRQAAANLARQAADNLARQAAGEGNRQTPKEDTRQATEDTKDNDRQLVAEDAGRKAVAETAANRTEKLPPAMAENRTEAQPAMAANRSEMQPAIAAVAAGVRTVQPPVASAAVPCENCTSNMLVDHAVSASLPEASVGMVAGTAVGSLLAAAWLVATPIACVVCCRRRRAARQTRTARYKQHQTEHSYLEELIMLELAKARSRGYVCDSDKVNYDEVFNLNASVSNQITTEL